MKRLLLFFAITQFAALGVGTGASFAQGHGGGPHLSHGPSTGDHGAMASGTSGSHGAASSSPTELLTRNTKLDNNLTTKLQSKNLIPAGTDLKSICADFRNLGQCLAAIHVSHNLKIPFACLQADMTGQPPIAGSQCPTGTGSSKLSLGRSIQALSPKADSKSEATEGSKEADSDVKEAESNS